MKFKAGLSSCLVTLTVAVPAIAQSVPSGARNACIQRTAEEMGVATREISVSSAGQVSAESGAVTLSMRNNRTGQTADCRVNSIDNTVLSVDLGRGSGSSGSSSSAQKPEFWVVTAPRTFLKVRPGILSKTATNNVPKGTVLRNLGCQKQALPTWCEVEFRDDPSVKGWAFTPNLSPYRTGAGAFPSNPSNSSARPGATVSTLADLVGARAGQAENTVMNRGYELRRSAKQADSSFTYWLEQNTGSCVAIRTTDGRYGAIVYTSDRDCNRR